VFANDCENAIPYGGSVKLRPVAGIRQVRLPPHLSGQRHASHPARNHGPDPDNLRASINVVGTGQQPLVIGDLKLFDLITNVARITLRD
jgi:hypothetical protein